MKTNNETMTQEAEKDAGSFAVRYRLTKTRFAWIRRHDDRRRMAVFTTRRAAQAVADRMQGGEVYDLNGSLDVMLIASTF